MNNFEFLCKKYGKMTMTREEVAEQLSVSYKTINRMLESNDLPITPVARTSSRAKVVFTTKSVARYLDVLDEAV